jgi:hypothetical protein
MNELSKSNCIIILGMHRSGTSALSGVLKIMGLNPGKELFEPEEDNPKGNFENARITKLNEKILDELYAKWNDTLLIPDNWWNFEKFEPYRQEIKSILLDESKGNDSFFIKDPRLSVLLPVYLSALNGTGITPRFIICCRNPGEIAASLEKRNNLPYEKVMLLWLDYQLKAEYYTRGYRRILIQYHDLLHKQGHTIDLLESFLDKKFSAKSSLTRNVASFLDAALKHHDLPGSVPEMVCFPEAAALFKIFSDSRGADLDESQLIVMDQIRQKFNSSFRFFNGLAEQFLAELVVIRADNKRESWKLPVLYGKNKLVFDLGSSRLLKKMIFKPSNSRVGLILHKTEIFCVGKGIKLIHEYETNAGMENEGIIQFFEPEMPEIIFRFPKLENITQVIFHLDYLVFGRATFRMSRNFRGSFTFLLGRFLMRPVRFARKVFSG